MHLPRRTLCSLLFLALASSSTWAEAAFITGTIGFNADSTTSNTGGVNSAQVFTFLSGTPAVPAQMTVANGTSSFSAVTPGTLVTSTTLQFTSAPFLTLTLGTSQFTTSAIITDQNTPGTNFRVVIANGTISSTVNAFDTTPARFILSFTQAGGPGTTISYSGTLTALAVPEPSGVALLSLGLAPVGVLAWRRRKLA